MFKLSCIIPSSCSEKILPDLKLCIQSLKNSSGLANVKLKIFLVSNSPKIKNPLGNEVDYFINTNLKSGFGVMNNIGIDYALKTWDFDYFLLINDDAYVKNDFFVEFRKILKQVASDFFCPIVYRKGTKKIDSWGIEYFRSGYASPSRSLKNKTALVSGTCVLLKKQFVMKMKLTYGFVFNPVFYFYHEDVEMSIRALLIGVRIFKSEKIVAYHLGQNTAKRKPFFLTFYPMRNLLWVIILTWPLGTIVRNAAYIAVVYLWLMWSEFSLLFPIASIAILGSSVLNMNSLLDYRKKNLKSYSKSMDFSSVFSPYIFRTRKKGIPIGKLRT